MISSPGGWREIPDTLSGLGHHVLDYTQKRHTGEHLHIARARIASHPASLSSRKHSSEAAGQDNPRLALNRTPQIRALVQRLESERLFGRTAKRQSACTAADLLTLQRSVGNRATNRLLRSWQDPTAQRSTASARTQPVSAQASVNNTGLPHELKAGMESLSGVSLDHIKVHPNSSQAAQLNALAYTRGDDIHLAPGQEQHLPHEAWHAVQQAQGRVQPTMQMKGGIAVNDDNTLEREADVMGSKAVAVGDLAPSSRGSQDRALLEQAHTQPGPIGGQREKADLSFQSSSQTVLQRGQGPSREAPPKVTEKSVMDAEVALFVLNKVYGKLFKIELKAGVVFHDSKETFVAAFRRFHQGKDPEGAVGFTVTAPEQSNREIHILRAEASFDAAVHELVHHNASEAWNKEFRGCDAVHEGVTQLITSYALKQFGLKASGVYGSEILKLTEANDGIMDNFVTTVLTAYFRGDKDAMNRPIGTLKKSLVQTCWFLTFGEWEVPEIVSFEAFANEGKK
jgi:Domain of unknown function (DUF4157)